MTQLSLPQQVDLLHGVGPFDTPTGAAGGTVPIPSLKVPALTQESGSDGIGDAVTGATQLPAPIALAATFNRSAARCYGRVIGAEARRKGIDLIYGPTVNIARVPQWGRTYESLGEDPYLTGTLAADEIDGLQSAGTMAEVKHFAVYNQETNRNTAADDAIVGNRTLHEIYLKQWQLLLAAEPAAVMCSYSTINGTPACSDHALIDGWLKGDMGFAGFVASDWNATRSTSAIVDGLDMEQPNAVDFGTTLIHDVSDGAIPAAAVKSAAVRVLTQIYRFRLISDPRTGSRDDDTISTADTAVAKRVALESAVLLKNDDHQLPIRPGTSVAVIGGAASDQTVTTGDGSSSVLAGSVSTPLEALENKDPGASISYAAGLPSPSDLVAIPDNDVSPAYPTGGVDGSFTTTVTAPETGTYILGIDPTKHEPGELVSVDGTPLMSNPLTAPAQRYTAAVTWTAGTTHILHISGASSDLTWATPSMIQPDLDQAVAAAQQASTAVVVVGDSQETESSDRASLALPSAQDELVEAVAAANPHTVVVVDAGGPFLMPWLPQVPAVLDAWYPGQSDGTALADLLLGIVNPSGHLPLSLPRSLSDTPVASTRQFPGVRGRVHYSEGMGVGYRWYDQHPGDVLFPFGYGLSYTNFRYSRPRVTVADHHGQPVAHVTVTVTDTGDRSGADVAQLYLQCPPSAQEPAPQLEDYRRVNLLSHRSATLDFSLRGLQLAHWTRHGWRIASGAYRVFVQPSSAIDRSEDDSGGLTLHHSYTVSNRTGR